MAKKFIVAFEEITATHRYMGMDIGRNIQGYWITGSFTSRLMADTLAGIKKLIKESKQPRTY